MKNSLMVMTGTLRAFDGYDRWERFSIQEFGSLEELESLKQQFENPFYSNRKYINLEIREATEQEKELYKIQLEEQLYQNEKEYEKALKKKQELATLIQEGKKKIHALEQLKIPN